MERASERGNLQIIKFLNGKNKLTDKINKSEKKYTESLYSACYQKHFAIIDYLMRNTNASLEITQEPDKNKLLRYIKLFSLDFYDINIMKFLIKDFEKFEIMTDNKNKLMQTISDSFIKRNRSNFQKDVKFLIEKFGETIHSSLFNTAVSINSFEMIKLLFEKYFISIEHLFNSHFSFPDPISQIIINGNIQIMKYFIEEVSNMYELVFNDNKKTSFLILACTIGKIDIIDYLITTFGIDVSRKDEKGVTPLYISLREGHITLFMRLIEIYNAKIIENETKKVSSILQLACERKNTLSIIDYLIKNAYYDLNETGFAYDMSFTPLILSCKHNKFDYVKYFISHGADLEKTNRNGYTALHIAAKFSSFEIIKYLIIVGANFKAKTNKNKGIKDCLKNRSKKLQLDKTDYEEIIKLCNY